MNAVRISSNGLPTAMDINSLLNECELVSHTDRVKLMVHYGQIARTDSGTKTVIAQLFQGSLYERQLGLYTCYGSRDISPALQVLDGQSQILHALVIRLLVLLANDEKILGLLNSTPKHLVSYFVTHLRRRRRFNPINAFVEQLVTGNGRTAILRKLLPHASKNVVERLLPQALEHLTSSDWTVLIQRHPSVAYDYVCNWVEQAERLNLALLQHVNSLLKQLAKTDFKADTGLVLLRKVLKKISLRQISFEPFWKMFPQEIAQIVSDRNDLMYLPISKAFRDLEIEQLLFLYKQYPKSHMSRWEFQILTSEQRLAIYQLAGRAWQSKDGVLSSDIVELLPMTEREAEARRHLKLTAFELRPQDRIPYFSFLQWNEAMALQAPFLKHNDADIRSDSICSQIAATRFQEAHLGDALQLVLRHHSEQDPVREHILQALANLPAGRWKEDHFDALERIIRDALNASDLSQASVDQLFSLVVRILMFHPGWASSQLSLIIREVEKVPQRPFPLAGHCSIKDAMQHIGIALLPIIKSWQDNSKELLLVHLAKILGDRILYLPQLLDMLEEVLQVTHSESTVTDILHMLVKYRPRIPHIILPRLLQTDPSLILVEAVRNYMQHNLQHLVTPYLGENTYDGRFSAGKQGQVLPLYRGFQRWTIAQQELFAQTLLQVIREQKGLFELRNLMKQLSGLRFVNADHLIQLTKSERSIIRDCALRALGHVDAGKSMPTLVEALGDERGRIAVYALRCALKSLPPLNALELLRTTPQTKITVAKEIVRLVGDLEIEEAYQYLLSVQKQELHRDVRIALLSALWSYPERPHTWEIFRQTTQDPNPSVAKAVLSIPDSGLSPGMRVLLNELILGLLSHQKAEVRLDALESCISLDLEDTEQLIHRCFELLHSPLDQESNSAASIIFRTHSETRTALVRKSFTRLLKDRRALSRIVDVALMHLRDKQPGTLSTTHAILDVLETDPLTLSLRLKIIFATLPWIEISEQLLRIGPSLHADRLVQAEILINQVSPVPDERSLSELELTMAGSDDERLRRLALVVLCLQSRMAKGWTEKMRARLVKYRQDKSLLVAEAACFCFPPRESDPDAEDVEAVLEI